MTHPARPARTGMRIRCAAPMLALALTAGSSVAHAGRLALAHYAPGAGALQLQIDEGAARALEFGDFVMAQPFTDGERTVTVTRADGEVLLQSKLSLQRGESNLLLVVGNGSEQAPFALRTSLAAETLLTGDQMSLQNANLAIVPGEQGLTVADCQINGSRLPEPYLHGTDDLADGPGRRSLSTLSASALCARALHPISDSVLAEASAESAPGDRLRRFVIGDGVHEAYRVVFVKEGNELQLSIPPTPDLAGLWYPPDHPAGSAVQIAYDANAPEGQRLSALMLGYDDAGDPTWRIVDPQQRVLEFVGGNPDGLRAATPVPQSSVRFVVHSCGSMTLVPNLGAAGADQTFFGDHAGLGKPLRLAKLYPVGCRGSEPAKEEVR